MICRNVGYMQATLRVGNLHLNLDSREVLIGGISVHLTRKEYLVLELLVRRNGIVEKETFLSHLYSDGRYKPEIRMIDVFISKLRKKLAQAGAANLITTIRSRGYMLRKPTTEAVQEQG
jgi:two-component system cell cycle response regulator CtrA